MKTAVQLLCLVILFACKKTEDKIQPSIENISESVYASGMVKSKSQYQVFSTVTGVIKEILVTKGQFVKKGTPILRINNNTSVLNARNAKLSAEYAELSANQERLEELKITINLAKDKMQNDSLLWRRQQKLWTQNIGTKIELEQKELNYENAVANYRSAIINYNDLQRQLELAANQSRNNLLISNSLADDYIVKSKIDGTVYDILKEPGEIVNNQSPIALIGDSKIFSLELNVDENDIVKIKNKQKVLITMDSYKGQIFEGRVTQIDPVMNERSKSFTIEADFVNPPELIYPFLTVEANIVIQTKQNALTIPRLYLVNDSYVITEKKIKKKVIIGLKDYQKVEILSGLHRNDFILKPQN